MSCTVFIGAQWGDEGKGKIVSLYSKKADIVARFQGGPNAGHTVKINDKKYIFRIVPSGMAHGKICVIGNGAVINIKMFLSEMNEIARSVKDAKKKIFISERAHIILPKHIYEDVTELNKRIGTTRMGVGPAYKDKVGRIGLRVVDLLRNEDLIGNLPAELQQAVTLFIKEYKDQCIDCSKLLFHSMRKKIILEGAQGSLLDLDYGNYPYVTSSNTTAAAACVGLGISPKDISKIYLVSCSYLTKEGKGPFVTKILDRNTEKILQKKGTEFDEATSTLRQCGWLDLLMLKHAIQINRPDGIIFTKLDVLTGFDYIYICRNYIQNKKKIDYMPSRIEDFNKCTPKYVKFKGWSEKLSNFRHRYELPKNLNDYLLFIEKELRIPILGISVGPEESQFIYF